MTEDKEADNKVVPFFRFVTNKPIFVEFLSKILNIREVGKLDLALTNTKYRFAFLKSLEEMRNNSINGMFCNDSLLGDHSSPHFLKSAEPMFKAGHSKTLLTWISKRRIDVKSINLFNFKDGEEALFIGSLQLSVRQLDVTRCSLRHIAQSCPFLEELTINESSMDVDSDLLTDLVFLCRHCTHLQRIHLKRVTLQSAALNDLQEFGHLFVEIDTHARQGLVTNPRFFEFIKRCTNLKVFSIFNANPQKPSLSDFGIIMRLEALEELTVIDCGLTNEKLALICACRHVKKLSLFEHSWTEGVFITFNGAGFRVLNGSPLSLTLESIMIDLNGWDFDVRSINGINSLYQSTLSPHSSHSLTNINLSFHPSYQQVLRIILLLLLA